MTLKILSTLGVAGVLREALPRAEAAGFATEVTLDPTARLVQAIEAGARGDIAILTAEAVAAQTAKGVLAPGTAVDLCHSYVGLAVKAVAPHPDISSEAAFRATLLTAPSLAYSRAGASGLFFAGLIERMGIAQEINAKATVIPQGFTAELAARGEVALAIQQVSELQAIPGVEIVGKLPPACNTCAVFTGALFTGAQPQAAALLDWIAGQMTPAVLTAAGLESPR